MSTLSSKNLGRKLLTYKFITPTYEEALKFKNFIRILLPDDNYIHDSENEHIVHSDYFNYISKPNFTYCEEIFEGMMKTANDEHLFEDLTSSSRLSLLNELMYNMFYDSKNETVYIILPETHEHIQNMLFGYKCRCQYCKYNECENSELFIDENNNNIKDDNDLSEISTIYINDIDDLYKFDLLDFDGLIVCKSLRAHDLEQIPEHLKTKLIHDDYNLIKFKDPDVPYFDHDYCHTNPSEYWGDCFYDELLSTNIATNYKMAKDCILPTFIDIIGNKGIVWKESDDESDSSDESDYEDEFHFKNGRLRYLYIDLDCYLPVLKEYFDNYEYITHSSKPHPNHLNELRMFQKNNDDNEDNDNDNNEDNDNDDDNESKENDEESNDNEKDNEDNNEKTGDNNEKMNYYSLLTCLNYINDESTLINLIKTCRQYSHILESCGTNLTSNYKLFENATAYTFYNHHFEECKTRWYFEFKDECKFPMVLPKYERYYIEEIFYTNLFYQLFRNDSKFHFKSVIHKDSQDSKDASRYYCDLNDINMVYISHFHDINPEYASTKIETVYIRSYEGTIDLRRCEKLKHVYAYMDSRYSGPILLPKHLKELIVIDCEDMNLYAYDVETLIVYEKYSPRAFPRRLKHLIIYNAYNESFRIDTECIIPNTLEDILFIGYQPYLNIIKGKYSVVSIAGTSCKSVTIGNTIINDDALHTGLFDGKTLNEVKKLNEKWL